MDISWCPPAVNKHNYGNKGSFSSMFYLWQIVVFHSYVRLLKGIFHGTCEKIDVKFLGYDQLTVAIGCVWNWGVRCTVCPVYPKHFFWDPIFSNPYCYFGGGDDKLTWRLELGFTLRIPGLRSTEYCWMHTPWDRLAQNMLRNPAASTSLSSSWARSDVSF